MQSDHFEDRKILIKLYLEQVRHSGLSETAAISDFTDWLFNNWLISYERFNLLKAVYREDQKAEIMKQLKKHIDDGEITLDQVKRVVNGWKK